MSRRRRRRRWLIVTALLLLIGAAGGAYYVFEIARSRTSPYEKALAARKADDNAGAEAQLRNMLKANPKDDRARQLLIQIVAEDKRVEEAAVLARHWLDDPSTETLGLRSLSLLALRRLDAAAAMRYARMVADRAPAFSQAMMRQIQDAMGTPVSRERSARAAETLAAVAASPMAQAEAWLYAAETLSDLEATLREGPARTTLAARRKLDRNKALQALRASAHWQARVPEATALMAGIELLSDDEDARRKALATCAEFLESHPEVHSIRSSMIRHLIATGDYAAAVAHARELRDRATLLFLRALSALARAGQRGTVLTLLDELGDARGPLLERMRARVLITGEGSERADGINSFETLARASPKDRALLQESYQRIKLAGDPERALRLLDELGAADPKVKFVALLEKAVASVTAGDLDAAGSLLEELASVAKGQDLVAAFNRLRRIEGTGDAASLALIDKALQSSKPEDATGVRLLRAALIVSRPGVDADGVAWTKRAADDLRVIAARGDSPRHVLVNAATLAAAGGETRLTGLLIGRALVADGDKGDPLPLFLRLCRVTDDAEREGAAEGLRKAASQQDQFGVWLSRLAGALEAGKASALRKSAAEAAAGEAAPQPTESTLQLRLAAMDRDWTEAEGYARLILATWPEVPNGVERLGAVLLSAKKAAEVLALHSGGDLVPLCRAQKIAALTQLERTEEAIAEARLLLRETEGSDDALLLLGQLLRKTNPDAAYALISPITGRANVDLFRGELLEGRGDEDSAAQVYEELLLLSRNRNMDAWRRLARVRAAQDRHAAFILRVNSVIAAPSVGMTKRDVAHLHVLRAVAREGIEDYDQALEDYRSALAVIPRNLMALNNAAWLIVTHIAWPAEERAQRMEQALELAGRAVALAPTMPEVFHTRGKILRKLAKHEAALADLDQATNLLEAIKKAANEEAADSRLPGLRRKLARYLLDKAAVLEAIGAVEQARALYERIQGEYSDTKEGRKAGAALARIGD